MKIMAVDFGDARTGLAVCDKTEFLASPVGVIHEKDFDVTVQKTAYAVQEYAVQEVIVGYPKNMNGTIGPRAEAVMAFAEALKGKLDLPVDFWDERLTTVAAHKMMIDAGMRRDKRKKNVDRIAAVLILQGFLDYSRR